LESDEYEEQILVRRERRVNFGDRSFEDEKFSIAKPAFPTLSEMKRALASLCHLLNQEELKARRNHQQMKRIWAEEQAELQRQEQLKADDIRREKMKRALDLVKEYPNVPQSDLANALELTLYEVGDVISDLVDEGKLRRRECRRLFDIIEPTES
jgi:MarR-like DNA-binding transcriptional regulator SgrR of sgrS sRNA